MSQLARSFKPEDYLAFFVLVTLTLLLIPLPASAKDKKSPRAQTGIDHRPDRGRRGLATSRKARESRELADMLHSSPGFVFDSSDRHCQLAVGAGVMQAVNGTLTVRGRDWLDLSVRNRHRLHIIAEDPTNDRASLKAVAAMAGQARKLSVKLWSIIRQAKRTHPSGKVTLNLEYQAVAHSREYVALRKIYRRLFRVVRARERAISTQTDYTHWYSSITNSARKCEN